MTKILISRLHFPVTVLGPGLRAGIWFQGCTIRCPGCASVDTWSADQHRAVDVAAVLDWLWRLPAVEVEGVTISGGEPTDQPEALGDLLQGITQWRDSLAPGGTTPDVLLFTGRDPDWLQSPGAAVLAEGVDAVVIGPYDRERQGDTPLRGSENQELVPLTPLGTLRYRDLTAQPRNRMQVLVADDDIWLVGIPLAGDLDRVRAEARRRGLRFRGTSWRS
jgi:anaerobic ribonucleoside-triphosphate reductase activating protein